MATGQAHRRGGRRQGQKTLHANNYREAADALLNRIQPGDALLVKASRGMALEKALENFLRRAERCQRITFWRKLETEK